MLLVAPLLAASAQPPPVELEVAVGGLRNTRGTVSLCLTAVTGKAFLKCDKDPRRVTRSLPAARAGSIRLGGLAPGRYSLLVMHDENANGRLDTALGLPREGFGFSGNPPMRMGPPHYASVHFALAPGANRQAITIRYLL